MTIKKTNLSIAAVLLIVFSVTVTADHLGTDYLVSKGLTGFNVSPSAAYGAPGTMAVVWVNTPDSPLSPAGIGEKVFGTLYVTLLTLKDDGTFSIKKPKALPLPKGAKAGEVGHPSIVWNSDKKVYHLFFTKKPSASAPAGDGTGSEVWIQHIRTNGKPKKKPVKVIDGGHPRAYYVAKGGAKGDIDPAGLPGNVLLLYTVQGPDDVVLNATKVTRAGKAKGKRYKLVEGTTEGAAPAVTYLPPFADDIERLSDGAFLVGVTKLTPPAAAGKSEALLLKLNKKGKKVKSAVLSKATAHSVRLTQTSKTNVLAAWNQMAASASPAAFVPGYRLRNYTSATLKPVDAAATVFPDSPTTSTAFFDGVSTPSGAAAFSWTAPAGSTGGGVSVPFIEFCRNLIIEFSFTGKVGAREYVLLYNCLFLYVIMYLFGPAVLSDQVEEVETAEPPYHDYNAIAFWGKGIAAASAGGPPSLSKIELRAFVWGKDIK